MSKTEQIYDPVFAAHGMRVYSREYVARVREENERLREGEILYNICPQDGFQERVCASDAGILIIGGRRGGGKTIGMLLAATRYIENPNYTIHAFRKEEEDLRRGTFKSSKKIYSQIARITESSMMWTFPSGASAKFEHLHDEEQIDRRFRGVEIPTIIIDELPQVTSETFFTLLAANRNSYGIPNKFIASCNPVGESHWLYKMLSWWINPDTGRTIRERDGHKRYFYKYGNDITEIYWGNTPEEVYQQAAEKIDKIWDKRLEVMGRSKFDLINSLTFIEGNYYENRIFVKIDPQYLGRLAGRGERETEKDIQGVWRDEDDSISLIGIDDIQSMLTNTEQRDGNLRAVIDVALQRDGFVIGAFDGNHLFDLEIYKKVGSMAAINLVNKFLEKNHIPLRNVAFDSDGIGQYLKEPLKEGKGGAFAFNGNSSSTDSNVWQNLKAECAEKFVMGLKEVKFSISESLINRKYFGKKLSDYLLEERSAIRRKMNVNKFQLIPKTEMKKILGGKSPDVTDMFIMFQVFEVLKPTKKGVKGLQYLMNF